MRSRRLHLLAVTAVASVVLAGASLAACTSGSSTGPATPDADLPNRKDGATETDADEDSSAADASKDGGSDAPKDSYVRDANGPGEAGALCSFNWDCQTALRCECDETTGCECKAGARGTGRNGLDPCADGNACASAVCVEGPPDSGFFCSDECNTSDDCVDKLPLCSTIAFVGRICIRKP